MTNATNAPLDAPLLAAPAQRVGDLDLTIGYGKAAVAVYRTEIPAQKGVRSVPESSFTGRDETFLAAELMVETTGTVFLPSWTEGDNSALIATDTMKNFTLAQAATYPGTTVEGLAAWVGRAMLRHYPTLERLRVTGTHLPFVATGPSGLTLRRLPIPAVITTLSFERVQGEPAGEPVLTELVAGVDGLRFGRLRGSAFEGFQRDEYTTLPETSQRPLEIGLSLRWWYGSPEAAVDDDLAGWVPAEQVIDLLGVVADETPSGSIQQMLWAFGQRLLERYPSLQKVWFEGENRTWSPPPLPTPAGGVAVYTHALPAHGVLRLVVERAAQ
jgi:urate oxidase